MFNSLNSIETENKIQTILRYSKIGLIILLPLLIIILLVRGCGGNKNYADLEKEMINSAKKIVVPEDIEEGKDAFVDLYTLEEQTSIGTLQDQDGYVCDKASGVLVSKKENKLNYTPYLMCGNYRSKNFPDNKANNYVNLKGSNIIVMNSNDTYTEPGFTASNGATVEIVGNVYNVPGIYNLEYNAVKNGDVLASAKRSIIVTNSEVLLSQADQNTIYDNNNQDDNASKMPIITLKGEETIKLQIGDTYREPGYYAYDKKDGDLTDNVQVYGSVDTSKADTYTITYEARNTIGYLTSKKRTIIVSKKETSLSISSSGVPSTATKDAFAITLQINGEGYKYTVLPNMTRNYSRTITYDIKTNGNYNFYIYDENGNVSVKTINVNNIDNNPPIASCSAEYKDGKTVIEVNNISSDIAGYSYTIDGNYTPYTNAKTYSFSSKALKAYVKVKDNVDNVRSFSCDVVDQSTTTSTPVGNTCDLSNIKVNVKSCFGGNIIDEVNFTDYVRGVVYGETSVGGTGNEEYLKAFIIFVRTYAIFRGGLENNQMGIRSCSSDQNYCNIYQGCYRYQTQAMFNNCMNFSMQRKGYYSPEDCANRVTTYPGSGSSINLDTVYTVSASVISDPYWDASWPTQTKSTHNTKLWHPALSSADKAKLDRLIAETDGLVLYDKDGKLAYVHYIGGACSYTTHQNKMCQGSAYKLGQQGKTAAEIVAAFAQAYPGHKIACYQGKTIAP